MDRSSMQAFYDKLFDIMEAATEDPTAKEQTAKMKGLTQKMFDVMGDEVSVSYSYMAGTPPFKLQEVIDVKDSAAMKALMTESIEYVNSLYKTMGIPAELKYEPAVSTYKDATIDTMSFSILASDDPNDTMHKEIEKMYGSDGLKYYLAQTQDKFYLAMGPNSEATLKTLIDKPTAAAAPSGDIKIALDALKDTPYKDFVCSVNVIKLMKGMGEMMQSMGDQANMGPVADMFSGLLSGNRRHNRRWTGCPEAGRSQTASGRDRRHGDADTAADHGNAATSSICRHDTPNGQHRIAAGANFRQGSFAQFSAIMDWKTSTRIENGRPGRQRPSRFASER
jgi:hypothetical protein